MIDGEKTTYESKIRRNKDRRLDVEGLVPRKQKGKNVDMVGRDTRNQKDWFIVESMATWDELSSKFLNEASVTLIKELQCWLAVGFRRPTAIISWRMPVSLQYTQEDQDSKPFNSDLRRTAHTSFFTKPTHPISYHLSHTLGSRKSKGLHTCCV